MPKNQLSGILFRSHSNIGAGLPVGKRIFHPLSTALNIVLATASGVTPFWAGACDTFSHFSTKSLYMGKSSPATATLPLP